MFSKKLKALCSTIKSKAHVIQVASTFALLVLVVPGMAEATGTGMSAGVTTKVTAIISELTIIGVALIGIVAAMVTAKVVFGLFKKA